MRTTHDDVRNIMDTLSDTTTDAIIDAYIGSANVMVTEVMGTTETSDILEELEKWLACHMIAVTRERQALKEEAGTAKITYTGKYGQNLSMTSYGQMVLALDQSGSFAATSLRPASIYAVTSFD